MKLGKLSLKFLMKQLSKKLTLIIIIEVCLIKPIDVGKTIRNDNEKTELAVLVQELEHALSFLSIVAVEKKNFLTVIIIPTKASNLKSFKSNSETKLVIKKENF
jgi:hypothetical protein